MVKTGHCDKCGNYGHFWARCTKCGSWLCGPCGCAVSECPVCGTYDHLQKENGCTHIGSYAWDD